MEVIKKKVEMLEIKTSINQIKTTVDSRQDQSEERILDMRTCRQSQENKMNTYDYNIQEFWDIIQR
jgi:hypothetical protein